ncbi:response regulator [Wielerella bovis]|uniref:response regulator n=1 Tax=Wielerella bovis TaxID=2917790 RepID=UPI0020194CBA|nr:response regulator [Wielerella bovis]ULJ60437.1 response regulator [Wielerella bovis]
MNPHILILEDEREIAELVEMALSRAHCSARIAVTAHQAQQLLAQETFDLLLLDVGLPDINGFDFLKIVRAQYDLPVMMLTAQDEETDRILGLELGADDYLGKPFSPRELVARIKAILRRTHIQKQPENDNTTLWQDDIQAHCIRYRGQALPLTVGEYRLLRTLLQRRERVFSREELLTAMFGDYHPSDPNTINTHIRALRQKLRAADIDESCIRTHHGLGYSFTC